LHASGALIGCGISGAKECPMNPLSVKNRHRSRDVRNFTTIAQIGISIEAS
jgi:hypothetical protein